MKMYIPVIKRILNFVKLIEMNKDRNNLSSYYVKYIKTHVHTQIIVIQENCIIYLGASYDLLCITS
jgi:hypothetical protein